jgi:hypothetical protein
MARYPIGPTADRVVASPVSDPSDGTDPKGVASRTDPRFLGNPADSEPSGFVRSEAIRACVEIGPFSRTRGYPSLAARYLSASFQRHRS